MHRLEPLRRVTARPGPAAVAIAVAAIAAFHLWSTPGNPPGFIRDEAAFAVNAWTLAESLEDQDGARAPLFFASFGDWKPPVFPYLLAGVFLVTGPDAQVARGLAAAGVLAAILVVALLAWRVTRSYAVTAAAALLAGATPWLYELGRVAFDTALTPLAVVAILLAAHVAYASPGRPVRHGILVGVALGALAYTYAAGRLLAPLFALALTVFLVRPGLRFLVAAWATLAIALLPMAFWVERHPGALTARYEATRFAHEGRSTGELVASAAGNYLRDLNVVRWVLDGDPKPYIHTWGAGQLLAATVVLALAGVGVLAWRRRFDAWWGFVVLVALLVPVPAALTEDRLHSLRLAPLPAVLALLAIPALAALADAARSRPWARAAAAAVAILAVVQFADFFDNWRETGRPSRMTLFEARVPALLERGFAGGRTLYVDYDDRAPLTHAQWHAVSHGLPFERVVRLSDGGVTPQGALAFGRVQGCDYRCVRIAEADTYWLARSDGPRP